MKTQLLSHLLIISFLFLLSCSGMEGTKGTAGARGPKGETGAKGDTGAQGAKGDTGAQGAKGDKGDTTLAGSGATGARGPKGDKGDKGDTGARGPKGDKGDKGDSGSGGLSAKYYDISVTFSKQNDVSTDDYIAVVGYRLPAGSVAPNDVIMVYLFRKGVSVPLPFTMADSGGETAVLTFAYSTQGSNGLVFTIISNKKKDLTTSYTFKLRVVVAKATVGKAPTLPSSLDLGNYDAVKEHFGLD